MMLCVCKTVSAPCTSKFIRPRVIKWCLPPQYNVNTVQTGLFITNTYLN